MLSNCLIKISTQINTLTLEKGRAAEREMQEENLPWALLPEADGPSIKQV